MPRELWKIDAFHGGFNDSADPRDIKPEELSRATGVMVDEVGRVRNMGDGTSTAHEASGAGSVTTSPGRGLLSFSHDKANGQTGTGTSGSDVETDYLAYVSATGNGTTKIYNRTSDAWASTFTGGGTKPSMSMQDGVLRVADANFAYAPQRYAYIDRTLFQAQSDKSGASPSDCRVSEDQWYLDSAEVKALALGKVYLDPGGGTMHDVMNRADVVTGLLGVTSKDGVTHDFWKTKWNWGVSLIYDGDETGQGQISPITPATSVLDGSSISITDGTTGNWISEDYTPALQVGFSYRANNRWTERRVTGFDTWMRTHNSSLLGGTWYHIQHMDWVTGTFVNYCAEFSAEVGASFSVGNDGSPSLGNTEYFFYLSTYILESVLLINPPIETYDVYAHHSNKESIALDGWGANVAANRYMYYGNIKQDGKVYGDRMLKSPQNQFDVIPASRKIDVSTDDGDAIIELVEYADRILQFKKGKMHLINVAGESEWPEDTFMHKGVSNPGAVCKTDIGVAWVNDHGVYLYDGNQVLDLTVKAGQRIIEWLPGTGGSAVVDWTSGSATDKKQIGYIANKRQLIISKDSVGSSPDSDVYVYDMYTQSWTHGLNRVHTTARTNWVNDWDGALVCAANGTLSTWDASSKTVASGAYHLYTRDVDFGDPARRKKIYRIWVTYKCSGDSNITLDYATNGDNAFSTVYDFSASTSTYYGSSTLDTTSGRWQTAELKPDTSSEANNVKSVIFRLTSTGTVPADFEINDITISFRRKSVR